MAYPNKLRTPLQDLPPAAARLCLRVRRALSSLLAVASDQTGQLADSSMPVLLVACSGGADSTALAVILHCLGMPICLAHLDHGLRPESTDEARKVQLFAEQLGVPCRIQKAAVRELATSERTGLEDAGRRARYAFLEEARRDYGAAWIATGHHLDDAGEDVILRLVRGTGWPGLAGMRECDPERRLIRPLLRIRRDEIESFLHQIGMVWIEDTSNQSDAFRRNRIRHHVVPLLREENPSFLKAIHSLRRLASEDEAYWNSIVDPIMQQVHLRTDMSLVLPRSAFIHLPKAIRLRVYAALIHRAVCTQERGQARSETVFLLDEACTSSRAARQFQFPGGLVIQTDAEGLTVFSQFREEAVVAGHC